MHVVIHENKSIVLFCHTIPGNVLNKQKGTTIASLCGVVQGVTGIFPLCVTDVDQCDQLSWVYYMYVCEAVSAVRTDNFGKP